MTSSDEDNPSGPDDTDRGSVPQSGQVRRTGTAPVQQPPAQQPPAQQELAQQPAAQQAPAQQPPAQQPPTPQPVPLAPKELWSWGAAGGLLSVLVTSGLFDRESIAMMLDGSDPVVQMTTLVILGIATVVVGGLWALAHKPIHSVMVALQLGILAPAAINALIAAANPNSGQITSLDFMDELFISTAYAESQPADPQKPSILDCIIKTLIKQPC